MEQNLRTRKGRRRRSEKNRRKGNGRSKKKDRRVVKCKLKLTFISKCKQASRLKSKI